MEHSLSQHPRAQPEPDDEATRLYAEYGQRIYRYCLSRLRSREEAEDALQNTFLRVCTALRKGVRPQYEGPWLFKIAHNVCLSRALGASRRARVETPHDVELLGERSAAHTPDVDELWGLDEALAKMPANLRRPLLMREWQGMSYAEIAAALDVSNSAVETLIFRARRQLAAALGAPARKAGRAIGAIFNLRWLFEAFRAFGGAVGPGGLAAGAAGVALVVGGGIGIDVAVKGSQAAKTKPDVALAASAVVAGGPSTSRLAARRQAVVSSKGAASTHGATVHVAAKPARASRSAPISADGSQSATVEAPAPSASAGPNAPSGPAAAGTPSSGGAEQPSPAAGDRPGSSAAESGSGPVEAGGLAKKPAGSPKSGSTPPVSSPSQPAVPDVPSVPDPTGVLPPVEVPEVPPTPPAPPVTVPPLPDPPLPDPPPVPDPPVSEPPLPPVPPVEPPIEPPPITPPPIEPPPLPQPPGLTP